MFFCGGRKSLTRSALTTAHTHEYAAAARAFVVLADIDSKSPAADHLGYLRPLAPAGGAPTPPASPVCHRLVPRPFLVHAGFRAWRHCFSPHAHDSSHDGIWLEPGVTDRCRSSGSAGDISGSVSQHDA